MLPYMLLDCDFFPTTLLASSVFNFVIYGFYWNTALQPATTLSWMGPNLYYSLLNLFFHPKVFLWSNTVSLSNCKKRQLNIPHQHNIHDLQHKFFWSHHKYAACPSRLHTRLAVLVWTSMIQKYQGPGQRSILLHGPHTPT